MPAEHTKVNRNKRSHMYVIYIVFPLLGFLILISVGVYFAKKRKRRLRSDPLLVLVPQTEPPLLINMIKIIHQGRYSCVWQAVYKNKEVAVKTLFTLNIESWAAEKDIYQKHNLSHKNILKFVAVETYMTENVLQHWIITEYHRNGSLSDYLQEFTINYNELIKMLLDIVSGLTYLHSGGFDVHSKKTVIAHRDIKSRNIIVKNDLTCCICDFGLAVAISVGKSIDSKSQTQVIFSQSNFTFCGCYVLLFRMFVRVRHRNERDFLLYFLIMV